MTTLMQAIARGVEAGKVANPEGAIRVSELFAQVQGAPRGSVRALIETILSQSSVKMPWAVILCRFKGLPGSPAIENLMRGMFAPGGGGLIEYWRDCSLGAIDISGSRVFGWFELDIKREQAGGMNRAKLVEKAVDAARRAGNDVLTGFYSQIGVFTHDCAIDSSDCTKGGTDWSRWIDGSADGVGPGHTVSAPPHAHSGTFLAHEMGHVFGLNHDFAADLKTAYGDLNSIMSAMNVRAFNGLPWKVSFGPSVGLPHLVQRGWHYSRRLFVDTGGWLAQPLGIQVPLAPLDDPALRANLGIKLAFKGQGGSWDYYLEYLQPRGWNRGLPQPVVVIRRLGPTPEGQTSVYLGEVVVPETLNQQGVFIEPSGNVSFQVRRLDLDGQIVVVTARKL